LNVKYFLCWLMPPVGILACGRPFVALLNLMLCCTIVGLPFACVWSYLVVAEHNADRRTARLARAIERRRY
jgi:hypothetical protein